VHMQVHGLFLERDDKERAVGPDISMQDHAGSLERALNCRGQCRDADAGS
jgi:hypothetical protein